MTALDALESLNQVRHRVSAGVLTLTPRQMVEMCDLFMSFATVTEETRQEVTAEAVAFVKRVCPAVMGGVN